MPVSSVYHYPGSRPFQDTPLERSLFFGRDHDREKLLHALLAEDIVVFFAQSGMGKTSLLNAGIMHQLREKKFLPLTARFNDSARPPQQVVYETMQYAGHSPLQPYDERRSLVEHLGPLEFGNVLLILDQFEEFFTLHSAVIRDTFLSQLAELIRAHKNRLKILISIREEFLGHLQEMARAIPGILRNRIRLRALTREQAKDAIIHPAGVTDSLLTPPFQYTPEAVDAILEFLCKQRTLKDPDTADEVEPFQLQVLCQHIEDSLLKTNNGPRIVQVQDLGGEAGMQRILHTFYNRQLGKIRSYWQTRRVRKLCEQGLISPSNRRLSLEEEDIQRRFHVSKDVLAKLVDVRLLRADPKRGSMYYELSHDNLIAPVRQSLVKRIRRTNMVWGVVIIVQCGVLSWQFLGGDVSATMGTVCYWLKDYDRASVFYTQAIERNPTQSGYYHSLGLALNKQGRYIEALANFDRAILLDPDYLEVKMKLAEVHLISERFEESMMLAREILQLNETAPIASILPEDILAMRLFLMTALLCQDQQSQAVEEGKALLAFYRSLPDNYERSWNYGGTEAFIRNTPQLSPPQKDLLLKILTLFEQAPSETYSIVSRIEQNLQANK